MRWFVRRAQVTDANPKVVGFFFAQYCEVMKHGKDKTDHRMKEYLFSIITGLGIPGADLELVEQEEIEEEEAPAHLPIIINRRQNGN